MAEEEDVNPISMKIDRTVQEAEKYASEDGSLKEKVEAKIGKLKKRQKSLPDSFIEKHMVSMRALAEESADNLLAELTSPVGHGLEQQIEEEDYVPVVSSSPAAVLQLLMTDEQTAINRASGAHFYETFKDAIAQRSHVSA